MQDTSYDMSAKLSISFFFIYNNFYNKSANYFQLGLFIYINLFIYRSVICLVSYETTIYNLRLMHEMYEQCLDVRCTCISGIFLDRRVGMERVSATFVMSGE